MKAELNLLAMALVLDSTSAPVEPADFGAGWLASSWRILRAGGGQAEMWAGLSAAQVQMVSDAVDALPPTRRPADLEFYARAVREAAVDRRVRAACERLHGSALVDELYRLMLQQESSQQTTAIPLRDVLMEIIAEAESVRAGADPVAGVPTGLAGLDRELTFGGLPRCAVTVLAGERSSGKSALAKTCVLGACRAGQRVWWGSFEDSRQAAATRMLSDVSGIHNRQLQRRVVGPTEWSSFMTAAGQLGNGKAWLWDKPVRSVEALCRLIASEVRRYDIDLVVIDYLQILRMTGGGGKAERVSDAANEIAQMTRGLDKTATLLVSQLARLGGERPTMDKLKWAGEIENAADTIGMLWKPDVGIPGVVALDLAKQKNGGVGIVPLSWRPETVSYRDPDRHVEAAYMEAIGRLT